MQPLISIIIPVFNGEEFVEKCVDSVLTQTLKELQIIIIDDGSTDHTLEIINKLAAKDKRITVIHQDNMGVSKARNIGLCAVASEWILFVDADDTIAPEYCDSMLKAATFLEADVVIAHPYIEGEPQNDILQEKEKLIQACLSYDEMSYPFNIDAPWGKIFRRQIIDDHHICFPKKLIRSEDAFFCLQFYEVASKIGILNKFGYCHSEREGSLCRSFMKNAPEILENILHENHQWVMKKHPDEKKYVSAMWYRVLPGIVECEKSFFLHSEFSGDLVREYQHFLKQSLVNQAIHSLKFRDVKSKQYWLRLLFYKLHLGGVFILIKEKNNESKVANAKTKNY